MRILIAGVLGGIAMFIWAAIGHDVLPLGQVGMKTIPNEAPVLAAMQSSLGDASGLYVFPGASMTGKAAPGPQGILVYTARPIEISPATLVPEALSEIVQSLILAVVMSAMAVGFLPRVGLAALIGVAAAMTTSASYWIWYRFPTDYTLAYMLVDWVRYVVAGIVIAIIIKPKAAAARGFPPLLGT